jgi:peptide-methionine (S)-S-oxide reductase
MISSPRPPARLGFSAVALLAAFAGAAQAATASAIFAGGCFWSAQHDLSKVPGVVDTVVGYTGGGVANPSYGEVSTETTGHYEAVRVTYDPAKISYEQLLARYWRTVDPTDSGGAFCDRGPSYRSAIFVTPEQRPLAEASKAALEGAHVLKAQVATQILPAGPFYVAEQYHQHYADKHPVDYGMYRLGCRRDAALRAVWGGG